MPESVRSYMTIEEVRALIATPVQDGRVKNAYLFSCFCGLRISDNCRPEMEECLCR